MQLSVLPAWQKRGGCRFRPTRDNPLLDVRRNGRLRGSRKYHQSVPLRRDETCRFPPCDQRQRSHTVRAGRHFAVRREIHREKVGRSRRGNFRHSLALPGKSLLNLPRGITLPSNRTSSDLNEIRWGTRFLFLADPFPRAPQSTNALRFLSTQKAHRAKPLHCFRFFPVCSARQKRTESDNFQFDA